MVKSGLYLYEILPLIFCTFTDNAGSRAMADIILLFFFLMRQSPPKNKKHISLLRKLFNSVVQAHSGREDLLWTSTSLLGQSRIHWTSIMAVIHM